MNVSKNHWKIVTHVLILFAATLDHAWKIRPRSGLKAIETCGSETRIMIFVIQKICWTLGHMDLTVHNTSGQMVEYVKKV